MSAIRTFLRRMVGHSGSEQREQFRFAWFVLVLLYAAVRIVTATVFLRKYGVHPVVFAAIELASSALYGWASGHLVGAVVDSAHHHLPRWAILTVIGYAAPDVYIVISGRHVPVSIYVILGLIVVVSLALTVRGLRKAIADRRS